MVVFVGFWRADPSFFVCLKWFKLQHVIIFLKVFHVFRKKKRRPDISIRALASCFFSMFVASFEVIFF